MIQFSPEIQLLVCCARTQIDPEMSSKIRALAQQDINWDHLVRVSVSHRVMPLLYRSLKATCEDEVPGDILKKLQNLYFNNTARNLFLSGTLQNILDLFKVHNIFAVPFKGPVLAETVYGDIALRQFTDLDILIYEDDAVRARDLLVSNGYNPLEELKAWQDNAFLKAHYSFTVISSDGRINVDLHWKVNGRYYFSPFTMDALKDRFLSISFYERKILTFSPEDLLLYLCLHGAKDYWCQLDHICCIAALLQSYPGLNWTDVTNSARKKHCERILLLGLFMAYDLFGVLLQDTLKKRIESDSRVKALASDVYGISLKAGKESLKEIGIHKVHFFNIHVRERMIDKILYCLQRAVAPAAKDLRTFPLPSFLSFLYYILRPVRITIGMMGRLYSKIGIRNV